MQKKKKRNKRKSYTGGVPHVAQRKRIRLVSMRVRVQTLASEGRWRSQMRLGSCMAVAVVQAGSSSSDLTPSLGTSVSHRCSPKNQKIKK